MEEVKDIILNVYTLSVPSTTEQQQHSLSSPNASSVTSTSHNNSNSSNNSGNSNSWSSFLVGKILPSMGMGAYHTSLRIGSSTDPGPYTTTYTFVAQQGIVQEKRSRNYNNNNSSLPSHATFKEEIILGSCTCQRGEINEIIQLLTQFYFTNTSYHLVHRNCNHFTETFATALIYYQDFIDQKNAAINDMTSTTTTAVNRLPRGIRLSTYPDWINRLANTGANVISHDPDIIPCHPYHEAYHAVTKMTLLDHNNNHNHNHTSNSNNSAETTTDKTTGRWGFTSVLPGSRTNATGTTGSTATSSSSSSTTKTSKAKKNEKKELTEAQKKLLEKIRKK